MKSEVTGKMSEEGSGREKAGHSRRRNNQRRGTEAGKCGDTGEAGGKGTLEGPSLHTGDHQGPERGSASRPRSRARPPDSQVSALPLLQKACEEPSPAVDFASFAFFLSFLKKYILLISYREEGRGIETSMREKHQSAASCAPPTGDVPATKVHALDQNRTWDFAVCRPTLYPLSQTGQGVFLSFFFFLITIYFIILFYF
uniref:Uncharacterized protein n=1 Tax=Myotis myotis TaxID=51298 RepID=A0A7J7WW63_MYOMY|nr:hypothetical protein mMyoMyo1_011995 [Myotis myotis]